MGITRLQAAQHLLKLKHAEDSYLGFIQLRFPDFQLTWFQLLLIQALNLLEKDQLQADFLDVYLHGKKPDPRAPVINNLLITMPPRHAKTTYATINFPAYYIARNPARYCMSCSYNSELATGFGREVREAVNDPLVQQAFPKLQLSQTSRAADAWKTTQGGAYFGVGLGGTTTGRPANLLIIDDPIKSREEAESATIRNKVWDYYTGSLSNRRQPDCTNAPPKTIVILTRWNVDDLAGRIQHTDEWRDGKWLHINFKAIEKQTLVSERISRRKLPASDPLYCDPEQYRRLPSKDRFIEHKEEVEVALWPERFPLTYLHEQKALNPRDFESLYQQNPYIEGGNILKSDWWRYYDAPLYDDYLTLIITADTAFKKTDNADYSVILIGAVTKGYDIHILERFRGRWDFPELKHRVITLNALWRTRGLRGVHIEDCASGQSLIQELRRNSGVPVIPKKVTKDKVARVNSITDIIAAGKVWLPKSAPWIDEFIEECQAFPAGANDDQVDALYILIDALSRIAISPVDMETPLNMPGSLHQQHARQNKTFGSQSLGMENDRDICRADNNSPFGKSLSDQFSYNHSAHYAGKFWKGWGH